LIYFILCGFLRGDVELLRGIRATNYPKKNRKRKKSEKFRLKNLKLRYWYNVGGSGSAGRQEGCRFDPRLPPSQVCRCL